MNDENESKGPRLTIAPEVSLGHYANFVTVVHNQHELLLDFARTLPGRRDIPVVSRLIMTPFHAKQLLRALSSNLERYEQAYGKIPDGPATPKVPGDAN